MAGLDVKVSQLGEVLVASDNDLLNLVTYDDQNQTYVSGKVKASTLKDYMIGDTDISGIGDGTPTGAIDTLDGKIDDNYDEWKEQWQKNGAYNWLNNTTSSMVSNNVTWTVNSDLSVTADTNGGTASGDSYFDMYWDIPTGEYAFVASPTGGSSSTYGASVKFKTGSPSWSSDETGSGITISNRDIERVRLFVKSGTSVSGKIFKPMITTDLNATYDDYVPHAMTNRQLTEVLGNVKEIRTGKFNFTNGASISGSVTYDTPFTGTGTKLVLITPESGNTAQVHVFCVNGQSNTGFNYIAQNITGDTSSSNRVAQYIAISY